MRRATWLLLLPALLAPLSAWAFLPKQYSAASIEARVVDKETGQPLAGVIVVAHWALESVSAIIPHQVNPAGSLMILEAVTDQDGWFRFPAWGPKWHWGSGELGDKDPELILFTSGYEYRFVDNSRWSRPAKYSDMGKPYGTESKPSGSHRISFWSGETIELKKFAGDLNKYEEMFEDLNRDLAHIATDKPEQCNWKKIPLTIRAMNRERRLLIAQGVKPNTLSTVDSELLMNDSFFGAKGGCGSPTEFFQGFRE